MLRRELPGKSRDRLMAAVQRKKGKQVGEIARLLGRAQGTISNWLHRLQDEGGRGGAGRGGAGRNEARL